MKSKSTQIVLLSTTICFMIFNIKLLLLTKEQSEALNNSKRQLIYLEHVEYMYDNSKDLAITRFKYEQYKIGDATIYMGSDNKTIIPILSIIDKPKLVLGLNRNMCRPCVEGAFTLLKEFYPDFESNSNLICIADIDQRFKDDYYGKKVVSFLEKDDFPLYQIDTKPFFFILDKDLSVKRLFITDDTSPDLTKEYLKIIKEFYPEISNAQPVN